MKWITVIVLCGLQTACASVTVKLQEPIRNTTSFTHHTHYGLFGLIGSDQIDLNKICMEGKVVRIQNYLMFEDTLFAITTLGLYTPKSTKIWCEWPPHTHQSTKI